MQPHHEHAIREQVGRISCSSRFKDASRSRRFLEFIVEETLAGHAGELKENVVGVHVFDRASDYDPRLDSIVRVEAGRLRSKLSQYYQSEGAADPVIITLPKGRYAPEFSVLTHSRPSAVSPRPASDASSDSSVLPTRSHSRRRAAFAASAVGLALCTIFALAITAPWRQTTPALRIAVLPFTPSSAGEAAERFAVQLTEKVTAAFVKRDRFSVVPSTTARQFAAHRPGVKEIAAALQADIIMEARMTLQEDDVKIEVRLSDGALDRKFWVGDQFVGANLDELASQIAQSASVAIESRR